MDKINLEKKNEGYPIQMFSCSAWSIETFLKSDSISLLNDAVSNSDKIALLLAIMA
jgi:hypothetical protein